MKANGIRGLLREADASAGEPVRGRISGARIRQRVQRKRFLVTAVPATVAAAALLTTALWVVCTQRAKPTSEPQRMVSLEEQIKQLQTQTQSTLKLVHDVLERERQDQRLAALEAELARIPDPAKELERQADTTAFLLLCQADRLYGESGRTESAIEVYRHIIERYPESRWADEARKKLSEIRQPRINKSDEEGAVKWKHRRA